MIFPRDRTTGLTRIANVQQHHCTTIVAHMIWVATNIAKQYNLNGYRLVINDGNLG